MRRLLTCALFLSVAAANAAPVTGQGTWETTLLPGDVDNDGSVDVYYDVTLNITWLADANLPASESFGVGGIGTDPVEGHVDWDTANQYVAAMNSAAYLGASVWRLPTMVDIDNDGCVDRLASVGMDCGYNTVRTGPNASEMSSMFYDTLGNLAFFDEAGNGGGPIGILTQNTGPFENLQDALYWTDLELITNTEQAWYFGMPSGGQGPILKSSQRPIWMVLDGNHFSIVPVPASAWLFASALGLLRFARRRQA